MTPTTKTPKVTSSKGPPRTRRSYPWEEMGPGDSFFLRIPTALARSVQSAGLQWIERQGRAETHAVIYRQEGDGFRFWLVERPAAPIIDSALTSSEVDELSTRIEAAAERNAGVTLPQELARKILRAVA